MSLEVAMANGAKWVAAFVLLGCTAAVELSCGSDSDEGSGGSTSTGGTAGTGASTSGGGSSGTGASSSTGGSGTGGASSGGGGTAGSASGGTSATGGAAGSSAGGTGGTGGSSATPFRFIAWADTKTATTSLSNLSDQAVALNAAFTIYPGDLVSTWSNAAMDTWVKAMNGTLTGDTTSNQMFEKTFPVRGNHEGSTSGFRDYLAAKRPIATTAAAVGATNFASMPNKTNEVYSFDYGNSHFVGLDALGDADTLSPAQISWFDQDLTAAESRGLTHAFLFVHGPLYCVDGHCCTTSGTAGICDDGDGTIASLIAVINKHPIVTATFHGHEHVYAYVYLDSKRDPLFKHPVHQFHTASAGAGPSSCASARVDWCMAADGLSTVDVIGKTLKVNFYEEKNTTSQKEIVINKP